MGWSRRRRAFDAEEQPETFSENREQSGETSRQGFGGEGEGEIHKYKYKYTDLTPKLYIQKSIFKNFYFKTIKL